MQTVIDFSNVRKEYRDKTVLSSVSFQVFAGECVGLVGVNGAGKTTIIKSLLDFCEIESGTIEVFSVSHRQTESRTRLTYLPEKFTPPYYLTGRDFLHYMADMHNVQFRDENILNILDILDLDPVALDKPVHEYSKGMGQKLGLAACLLSGRDLLIFDEPMSGLDPLARARLKKYLLQLKQQGRTIFYSTHLLEDVAALCDRVIILHEGNIRFSGTINECCARYRSDDLESAYLACVA